MLPATVFVGGARSLAWSRWRRRGVSYVAVGGRQKVASVDVGCRGDNERRSLAVFHSLSTSSKPQASLLPFPIPVSGGVRWSSTMWVGRSILSGFSLCFILVGGRNVSLRSEGVSCKGTSFGFESWLVWLRNVRLSACVLQRTRQGGMFDVELDRPPTLRLTLASFGWMPRHR